MYKTNNKNQTLRERYDKAKIDYIEAANKLMADKFTQQTLTTNTKKLRLSKKKTKTDTKTTNLKTNKITKTKHPHNAKTVIQETKGKTTKATNITEEQETINMTKAANDAVILAQQQMNTLELKEAK